ncbi:OB-fold domain-containing protein [Bradyrhizobium sp. AS23.2]|uniref:Zn-ribbon domain-containing OB-fold protein n=1 Tax=Bradyrhizobium sp. AS23.2 TaxID=1680155 RepID=UPI001FD9C4FE|nr:OB-fold domain-containing protein [Bradyrhizobium sp. AS23.2]
MEKASGRGKVYSFTVLTKDKSIVAYVKLDEGPIMLTSIVDTDPEKIGIGSEVTVTFQPTEDGTLVPLFRGA